jgi:hypothetical protein
MSTPILPFAVWAPGTNQNSVPANDNSLRNQILNGLVISDATAAQPGSPTDGDIYIIPAAATGAQWATFDEFDLAIYSGGTWYAFAPVEGVVVNLAGELKTWDGAAYVAAADPAGSAASALAAASAYTDGEISALGLADGTFTPTTTNITNAASSSIPTAWQYLKVGNTVTMSGQITVTPTAATTLTEVQVTLAVASDIAATGNIAGSGSAAQGTSLGIVGINGSAPNNTARIIFTSFTNTAHQLFVTITYRVL